MDPFHFPLFGESTMSVFKNVSVPIQSSLLSVLSPQGTQPNLAQDVSIIAMEDLKQHIELLIQMENEDEILTFICPTDIWPFPEKPADLENHLPIKCSIKYTKDTTAEIMDFNINRDKKD